MDTKLTLTIDGIEHAILPEDIENWGEVMCTYKRSNYSGVMRSFSSQFAFVGDAYNLLMTAFLSKRFFANAKVAIYLIDNYWHYNKDFECPLDFSTVEIENGIFRISAIDNSLAAMIKANKSTCYEFVVGDDIEPDSIFHFDRLPMINSVTYEFTDGESDEHTSTLRVEHLAGQAGIWMGTVSSEVSINRAISWNEDQTDDDDSYALQAEKASSVTLDFSVAVDRKGNRGQKITLSVEQINERGELVENVIIGTFGGENPRDGRYVGYYMNEGELPNMNGGPTDNGKFALVGSIVYVVSYIGNGAWIWENTQKTETEYFKQEISGNSTFNLSKGDKLRFRVSGGNGGNSYFSIMTSCFKFSWAAKGDMCDIDAFTPGNVLDKLMERIANEKINAHGVIDFNDERLARTYLLASESVRDIDRARLYTSFKDFCDWMETVFGYTYTIGEPQPSRFTNTSLREANGFASTPYPSEAYLSIVPDVSWIYYNASMGKFMVSHDGHYYHWANDHLYHNPNTGHPYTDRLYRIGGKVYYFELNDDSTFNPQPIEHKGSIAAAYKVYQEVRFMHRSQLFNANADVKVISNARDAKFSVDSSTIYSTIEIGYEKKEYDSVNGRDEFNFKSQYSTGCTLSDSKLSLISKYRADCYGIEFAAQKRGEDTSDTSADKDIFFVLCESAGVDVYADRSVSITNALSDDLFNGEFSPMHCIRANAGYIGMMSEITYLAFTSSEGNSDIMIDGEAMNSNIILSTPLMTPCVLEFNTYDFEVPPSDNVINVDVDGVTYCGYIGEIEYGIAKDSTVKYKIFIKDIEL